MCNHFDFPNFNLNEIRNRNLNMNSVYPNANREVYMGFTYKKTMN